MITLQNNFTTPEQSKRLLELGVPADSADCYFNEWQHENIRGADDLNDGFFLRHPECFPCWSVGRLIEIVDMCSVKQDYAGKFEFEMNKSYIQNLICLIIGMLHTKDLDFSKLEE